MLGKRRSLKLIIEILISRNYFLSLFIFERERERERTEVRKGQRERERERQNPKQAAGSELLTQSPTQGSNPPTVRL